MLRCHAKAGRTGRQKQERAGRPATSVDQAIQATRARQGGSGEMERCAAESTGGAPTRGLGRCNGRGVRAAVGAGAGGTRRRPAGRHARPGRELMLGPLVSTRRRELMLGPLVSTRRAEPESCMRSSLVAVARPALVTRSPGLQEPQQAATASSVRPRNSVTVRASSRSSLQHGIPPRIGG